MYRCIMLGKTGPKVPICHKREIFLENRLMLLFTNYCSPIKINCFKKIWSADHVIWGYIILSHISLKLEWDILRKLVKWYFHASICFAMLKCIENILKVDCEIYNWAIILGQILSKLPICYKRGYFMNSD